MPVHYDRASTDKQFCRLMVELVETLTVGLVEALSNLHVLFINPFDMGEGGHDGPPKMILTTVPELLRGS